MSLAFNISSLLIFVAILVGVALHHRVRTHVRIMKVCFTLDVLLLILVEVFRGAIEKLLGLEPSTVDGTMLAVHVPLAVGSLVWWILQLRSGSRILAGRRELLPRHALHARIFLLLRLGNLVTAFLLY